VTLRPGDPASSALAVSVDDERGPATVVRVRGEIDASSVDALRIELDGVVDAGRAHVVVDLRDVGFMDSSGLATLLTTRRRAQGLGGEIAVVCGEGVVRHVLELTGLDKVMPIFPTPEEAIAGEFSG